MEDRQAFGGSLCNRDLIQELCRELGISIILFTADGTFYWGVLSRIDDGRFARLTPPPGHRNVVVVTPGGAVYREDFTIVDLCLVVAKSVNVVGTSACNNLFGGGF